MSHTSDLATLYEKARLFPKEMTFDELVFILENELLKTGCPYNIRLGKSTGSDYIRVSSSEHEKISVYHTMMQKLVKMTMTCKADPENPNGFSLVFSVRLGKSLFEDDFSLEGIAQMTRYVSIKVDEKTKQLGDEGFW